MSIAYIDTSALVAVAFAEPSGERVVERLADFPLLISSNLLEAEFCSALAREGFTYSRKWLEVISWVYPDRPLTKEFNKILDTGYLKGADLWHVATALYVSPDPRDLAIITLDIDMKSLTSSLGFTVV